MGVSRWFWWKSPTSTLAFPEKPAETAHCNTNEIYLGGNWNCWITDGSQNTTDKEIWNHYKEGEKKSLNITNISTLEDVIYKRCEVALLHGTVRHTVTYTSATCHASIRVSDFGSSSTRALWFSIDFNENCIRDRPFLCVFLLEITCSLKNNFRAKFCHFKRRELSWKWVFHYFPGYASFLKIRKNMMLY